jgi:hypothetical protein
VPQVKAPDKPPPPLLLPPLPPLLLPLFQAREIWRRPILL